MSQDSTTATISRHPGYDIAFKKWKKLRDCFAGEEAVKAAGEEYLPKTSGQRTAKDVQEGEKSYQAYKGRAVFFCYVGDTQKQMLGVMHSAPPETVELPSRIEGMKDKAATDGSGIERLMSRINAEQLVSGRYGLLLDIPDGEGASITPVIIEYPAEKILDWYSVTEGGAERLVYLLLDESGQEFNLSSKSWETKTKYRVCAIDPASGFYYSKSLDAEAFSSFDLLAPALDAEKDVPHLGDKRLDKIPFTFVNALDCDPAWQDPPLISLANICLAIYRGEADYRQSLFMQGQATLFLKGFDEKYVPKVGAGACIITDEKEADGKYLEVSGLGLPEQRSALENLHAAAMRLGLALIDQGKAESGDALGKRMSIKTASMKNIALAGADAVVRQCKLAAEWAGADPGEVVIKPNLDYSDAAAAALDALNLWTMKLQGAPLSAESFHAYLQKNGYTEKTYEEEKALCEQETGFMPTPAAEPPQAKKADGEEDKEDQSATGKAPLNG